MNDAKTEILRVRMTPMEKAALSRQANDQHKTMSEYIRSIAKCPPEVTRDEFEGSILQMIYEINKIGVNINQIAKKYNEHNYVEPRADLLEKLDEVYGMMKSTILDGFFWNGKHQSCHVCVIKIHIGKRKTI